MEKYKWILLFLSISLFACNDNDSTFDVSMEDLKISLKPVAGGAMMYYSLPDDGEIFAMNVRYSDFRGEPILKSCGYSGDSLLLDGFIKATSGITAQVSLVNKRNEESVTREITFDTEDSAPWTFLDDDKIEVSSSWNGFQVIYKPSKVVTGMAHVFYIGINPKTGEKDTILVRSFPILATGDTLSFALEQENLKNTVILRTEDFSGYRVRQKIYPNIDAFIPEQWKVTEKDFIAPRFLSKESEKAKIGVKYLFDGELKGKERLIAAGAQPVGNREGVSEYGAFLAGPQAFNKPFIIDLREEKVPAWIRMYCLYPIKAIHPAGGEAIFSDIWQGSYEDKVPCKVSVYAHVDSKDPNAPGWVKLGGLYQDPLPSAVKNRWSYLTTQTSLAPSDIVELEERDPIYVDVQLPPTSNAYRYLKLVVEDTFDTTKSGMNYNRDEYFTLQELEVFVKKES